MCFEQKKVGDRGLDEEEQRLGALEEDRPRINVGQNVANGLQGPIQVANGPTVLQSLPQGSLVRWDRFLPIRSLKVLLVENDDSTRHVVGALLRNCSYEVNGVANGLQAWKFLEDPNNHPDIILTEVVMPVVSGIALLCKIMSHKSLKNIPVIMMSSHDSMGLVFKCLSKGAVDFLVKPIRKNELKNLWQHVWRRCHSSSGSGSESGTNSRKYVKPKGNNESENNSCSSNEQDNGSTDLSIRDGSDHGSGIQSSRAVECHNDNKDDGPDSTCAQVIHAKPENCINVWLHSAETKECPKSDEQDEKTANSRDLECEYQQKKSSFPVSRSQPGQVGQNEEKISSSSAKVNCTKSSPNGVPEMPLLEGNSDSGELPSLELTLKGLRGAEDECNVLRHSDLSAFSKYNTPTSANQAPTGNEESCSIPPNSGPSYNFQSNSNSTNPNQQLNETSNNNNDDKNKNKNIVPKHEALSEKPEPGSAFKSSHTSAFQPVFLAPKVPPKSDDKGEGSYQQVRVQHHHHHHHHYHHHVHNVQQNSREDQDDLSLKDSIVFEGTSNNGSSNVFGGNYEGQVQNYSVNESGSGSNHGSNNGGNGSGTVLNAGVAVLERDNGVAGNSEDDAVRVRNGGTGMDESWVTPREAALSKFRQKRKERCFEKKVRYHSRKKLAEQRPRIRGQFVRQRVSDNKEGEEDQFEELKSGDNSGNSVQSRS